MSRPVAFVGSPVMSLTLPPNQALAILPTFPQQDSPGSAQCLPVNLCVCYKQLLDKDYPMKIGVVTNLIMGDGQCRLPVPQLLEVLTGVILVDL